MLVGLFLRFQPIELAQEVGLFLQFCARSIAASMGSV
jgi:hypothetical protein